MNPRDIIAEALRSIPPLGVAANGWEDDADAALVALAERGFVVVACPPGGRVVVDRTAKPCATCNGPWHPRNMACEACGGSGVVEATTTYGLAEAGFIIEFDEQTNVTEVQTFTLVALPEETP